MRTRKGTSHDISIRRQRGLTLIEIMVVILILGLIASAVGTNVFGLFAKSKIDTAKSEIKTLVDNISLYAAQNGGQFPESLEQISEEGYLTNVAKGEAPVDPWNRPYRYELDDNEDAGFVVWSEGEKANDDSDDIRSTDLGRKERSR